MVGTLIDYIASPTASLLFGALCLLAVVLLQKHRNTEGRITPSRVARSLFYGALLYMICIILLLQFLWAVPVGVSIEKYFGSERMAWLLVFVAAEVTLRLFEIFSSDLKDRDRLNSRSGG